MSRQVVAKVVLAFSFLRLPLLPLHLLFALLCFFRTLQPAVKYGKISHCLSHCLYVYFPRCATDRLLLMHTKYLCARKVYLICQLFLSLSLLVSGHVISP